MRRVVFLALVGLVVPGFVAADQPDRVELLGSPKVIEGAIEPQYIDFTPENLVEEIKVVSGRCYALFGFNNPEVQIHLPRNDNNVYASVEFSPALLRDSQGNEVPFELERGLYDHDAHADEIRFAPLDGDKPVEFDRVEGTITLRYPLRIRAVSLPAGSAPPGLTVAIDGPFVAWSDPEEILAEAASFTPFDQFRAIDKAGRRLEQHPWEGFSMRAGASTETYAYWGEVAEIHIDVVEQWAEVNISYSLPSIEPLPKSRAGTPPETQTVEETPGGRVDIQIVPQEATPAMGTEDGPSKDAALAQLKDFGFRRFDANSFVLAATQGNAEALRLFLAAGMAVDSQAGGRTALMSAAMMGRVEAGKVLIEAGADVNRTDVTGTPPLSRLVMQCGATELVRAFIDAGADLSVELRGGVTLLQMAELTRCGENARVLKEAGPK